MKNFSNILKISLLHFIYVPLTIIAMLGTGEDSNTLGFAVLLSIATSIVLYIYNVSVIFILSRVLDEKKIISNLSPILLLLILFPKTNEFVQGLDFGGEYKLNIFLIITFVINMITYFYLNKDSNQAVGDDILDAK